MPRICVIRPQIKAFYRKTCLTIVVCLCCLVEANTAYCGVVIDKIHPDRLIIGPDKIYDWVQIDCVSHLAYHNVIVNDYCDKGPILKVVYDPVELCLFVTKAHSKWVLFMDRGIESIYLRLINPDRGG